MQTSCIASLRQFMAGLADRGSMARAKCCQVVGASTAEQLSHCSAAAQLLRVHLPPCQFCRAILDDLARLGFHFRGICAFIDEEAGSFASAPGVTRGSMYCRALTAGLQGTLWGVWGQGQLRPSSSSWDGGYSLIPSAHRGLAGNNCGWVGAWPASPRLVGVGTRGSTYCRVLTGGLQGTIMGCGCRPTSPWILRSPLPTAHLPVVLRTLAFHGCCCYHLTNVTAITAPKLKHNKAPTPTPPTYASFPHGAPGPLAMMVRAAGRVPRQAA